MSYRLFYGYRACVARGEWWMRCSDVRVSNSWVLKCCRNAYRALSHRSPFFDLLNSIRGTKLGVGKYDGFKPTQFGHHTPHTQSRWLHLRQIDIKIKPIPTYPLSLSAEKCRERRARTNLSWTRSTQDQ